MNKLIFTSILTLISSLYGIAQSGSFGNTFIHQGGEMAIFGLHNFQNGGTGSQPGTIGTERSNAKGYVSFVNAAGWVNATPSAHVDGYVKTYKTGPFVFPIGDNGKYRPAAISDAALGNPVDAAYFNVDASIGITSSLKGSNEPVLPSGGPFNTASTGANIIDVSNIEYWDINGGNLTAITLTWDSNSNINTLTGGDLAGLTIVGWDGSNWVEIPSVRDATSLLGGASTLTGGSISTTSALMPDNFNVYTLAWKAVPEICDDGIDNDGDGLIDCADPDCENSFPVTTNVTSPSICRGQSTNISAMAIGSGGPFSYAWDNGLGNGISHSISPFASTTYTVTATNAGGCTTTAQVSVTVILCSEDCTDGIDNDGDGLVDCDDPDCGLASSTAVTDASCGVTDGNVTIVASGGSGSFQYSSDNSNWQVSNFFNGLSPGNYVFYARNTDGTCPANLPFSINELCEDCTDGIDNDNDGLIDCADPDCSPSLIISGSGSICIGNSADLAVVANGGTAPYSYAWNQGLGNGDSHQVTPVTTTVYTVTVSSSTGCTATGQATVTVVSCPEDCTDGIDNDGDGLVDCDDPDCQAVGMPDAQDDVFTTCPGVAFQNLVSLNDGNLQNPTFSIISNTVNGSLSFSAFGAFEYTPNNNQCGSDQFTYQVCNQTTGCCATASATINIGDNDPPQLLNLPADLTISCDDEVPVPPVILGLDACPGIYVSMEETDNSASMGTCGNFIITRTWSATDLCGNSNSGSQLITVQDNVKPELFRLHTLPNGSKMVAGVAKGTSHLWKYVKFPVNFSAPPLVFAQLSSNAEGSAANVQVRYVTNAGFQIRLMEEETADKLHAPERVSWMAIEKGHIPGSNQIIVDVLPAVNQNDLAVNYVAGFSSKPVLIACPQTTNEVDVFNIRTKNETSSSIKISLQEEQSKDIETSHGNEQVAYFAMTNGAILYDENGDFVGENGMATVNQNWQTINLTNKYNKPVVLFGGLSSSGLQAATVRVRNVTQTTFEVRIQEWDYEDGNHPNKQLGYLVVEGSIPTDPSFYCFADEEKFQPGVNLFGIDNCDAQVAFAFTKNETEIEEGIKTMRTWIAIDDCGNVNLQSRTDTCKVAAVRIKALLAGALIGTSSGNQMRTDLSYHDYLPIEEPYSGIIGFHHEGKGGNEETTAGILGTTGSNAIVDWLFIEIRDQFQPDEVLATASVLVKKDGSVVSTKGKEVVKFYTQPEGDYVVSVRHRNHLGLAAVSPFFLSVNAPPLIDFTALSTNVLNGSVAGKVIQNQRSLWPGDLDGNGKAVYQGPGNDIFALFSEVLGAAENEDFLANYILPGYYQTDLNLDGKTIYQGPNNDRALLLFNTVLVHSGNTNLLANYIVTQNLP